MTGPSSVEAGAVQVEFTNSSSDDAGVTLIRVEGDHSAEEARKAGEAWGDGGKPLPEWITFEGGSGSVHPGKSFSAVQKLASPSPPCRSSPRATTWVSTSTRTTSPELEVTGDGDGELPSTDGEIDAVEYSFDSSGLKAGNQQVTFTNKGKEPHFVLAAPIKPGNTIEDVRKSVKDESGPSAPRSSSPRRCPRASSTAGAARWSTSSCRRATTPSSVSSATARAGRPTLQGHDLGGCRRVAGGGCRSGRRVSNPRPSAWEADALPTELRPRWAAILEAAQGRGSTLGRGEAALRGGGSRRRRRRRADRAARVRRRVGGADARSRRSPRQAESAPEFSLPPLDGRPRALARRLARAGRGPQLLGVVVRAVPRRVAAARALAPADLEAKCAPCSASTCST